MKLDKIEEHKCRGAAIRSRVQYMLEGERCTAFFLGLEKQKQNKNNIQSLETDMGEKIDRIEDVLIFVQ